MKHFAKEHLSEASQILCVANVPALKWTLIQTLRALNRKQKEVKAIFFESAVFPRMKNWHTKKTRNGSKFGWLIQQMSINQNSGPQTFHRRFVSGCLFVSPCLLECYLQSETKIESDLTLRAVGGTCQWHSFMSRLQGVWICRVFEGGNSNYRLTCTL